LIKDNNSNRNNNSNSNNHNNEKFSKAASSQDTKVSGNCLCSWLNGTLPKLI